MNNWSVLRIITSVIPRVSPAASFRVRAVLVGAGTVLAIAALSPGWAQGSARVHVLSPTPEAVFGWGKDAPELTLSARLEGQGDAERVFLTANVLQGERIVDGVRLYDDGTHGDERAADGTYTARYRPPAAGTYSVRVRGVWDGREAWSEARQFHVETVPYPHLAYPVGGRVGRECDFKGRLLLNGEPYRGSEPGLRVEARTATEPYGDARATPGKRSGSSLTGPIRCEGLGRRWVTLVVSVERRGTRLETVDGPVAVDVANPPLDGFWVALVLLVAALAAPRRKNVPIYQYQLRVLDARDRHTLKQVNFTGSARASTPHTLGGDGSDTVLPGGSGVVCRLMAAPGQRELQVEAVKGTLKADGRTQPRVSLAVKKSFTCGGWEVIFADAQAVDARTFSFWHPTRAKAALVFAALAAGGIGVWQYVQFFAE